MQRVERGCLPCTNCLVTVPQDRYFAVEKFGRFSHMLKPGLATAGLDCCGLCIGFRSITSRTEQNLVTVQTKTKDNVFVHVKVAVQQAVMPEYTELAMYKLDNVHVQIESYVADVVRSYIPQMTLDEAFEKKDDISDAVQKKLAQEMANFGFSITKALVTEVTPNSEVVASMNEINKQKRLRDASQMAAEAEKIKVVKAAEAAADAAQLQGEGIARQRRAIIDGLRDSITHGSGETLSTEKISELLLITQYFETLRDVAASNRSSTVFLPSGPHSLGMSTKWLTTQCDFPTLEKSGVQVEVQKKKSKPTKSQKKVQTRMEEPGFNQTSGLTSEERPEKNLPAAPDEQQDKDGEKEQKRKKGKKVVKKSRSDKNLGRAEEQEMQGEVNTGDRDAEKEERHHIGPEVHDPGGSEVEVATADQSLDSGLMAAPAVEWSEEEPVLEEGAPLVAGAPLTQKARTKKIKAKTKTVKMKRDQQSVQGPGAVGDVSAQIRNGLLTGAAGAPGQLQM